jgi:hypothetical protein
MWGRIHVSAIATWPRLPVALSVPENDKESQCRIAHKYHVAGENINSTQRCSATRGRDGAAPPVVVVVCRRML